MNKKSFNLLGLVTWVLLAVMSLVGAATAENAVPSSNTRPGRLSSAKTPKSQQSTSVSQRTEGILDELASGTQNSGSKDSVVVDNADRDETRERLSTLPNTMEGLNDKRQLGIGDKLSFKVVEDEGPPRLLSITDSNEVDVPYIGRVSVNNKTCKEFALYIKKLLEKDYYFQATVIVGLDSAGNGAKMTSRGKVYVMGQVRSPGAQELPVDEVYSVTTAILRAGGFGPYANKRKVKLVRSGKSGSGSKPLLIDCAEILDKAQWQKDVEVNPGDIITVPEKMFNVF